MVDFGADRGVAFVWTTRNVGGVSFGAQPEQTPAPGAWLHERRDALSCKGHDLDAETGSDGFNPVAEQPRQTLYVAHRQRRSNPDRLDTIVDPVKEQIETPCPEPFGFERLAELHDELGRIAGDGFRGADRLGEAAANLDEVGRANRIDRLGDPPEGLIETPPEFGTKTKRQRRAGFCRQLANAFEAEDA